MKIASRIDKRTHTKLSKLNAKYLRQEIESTLSDLMLEANFLIENWDPENKFMDSMSEEHVDTIKSWQKDVKLAFREFKRDKIKLDKALSKGSVKKCK